MALNYLEPTGIEAGRHQRHIFADATYRIKCGAPHLSRENRTPGSEGGDGERRFLPLSNRIFALPVAVVAPCHSPNSVRRVRQAKNPLQNALQSRVPRFDSGSRTNV